MSVFELPDLYMPYPARLNPHVDATRVHTKAWATRMGMIRPHPATADFSWAEADFDAHEFALLAGYTQPDLPAHELDLMADWYVWLFFFDDYFIEVFKRGHDVAAGKRFLDRCWDFLPLEPGSAIPAPSNPVERGMAELWQRTRVGSTPAWQRRYVQHVEEMLGTVQWEHYNMRHGRVANPLEYVAMRRMVGGCVWAACLVERANGLRLPDSMLEARPVRVIHEAFADCEHLHNDLMSYSREVGQEGERANAVLVFERFLGVEPQRATNFTADLISARLHQFEHAVLVELPDYFEGHAVPEQQRSDVLRYAKGVLAWISGAYEWHFHSSRYDPARRELPAGLYGDPSYLGPTGLADEDSRILEALGFRTRTRCEPALRSEPAGPPSTRPARSRSGMVRLGAVRRRTRAWAADMGMFDEGVWTLSTFEADDIPARIVGLGPEVELTAWVLASDWSTWAAFVDDFGLEHFARDQPGAKAFTRRLASFLVDGPPSARNPAEQGLADLWQRSTEVLSDASRAAFARRIEARLDGLVWMIGHAIHDRAPDLIDYCEMRRRGELALSLLELAGEHSVPPAIFADRMVSQLHDAFCDVIVLGNDVDAVVVVQRLFGCDRGRAAAIAGDLLAARMDQFEHISSHYLPELFDELGLDEASRLGVRAWVGRLESWMAADLDWSRSTGRHATSLERGRPLAEPDDPLGRARNYLAREVEIYRLLGVAPQHPQLALVGQRLDELVTCRTAGAAPKRSRAAGCSDTPA